MTITHILAYVGYKLQRRRMDSSIQEYLATIIRNLTRLHHPAIRRAQDREFLIEMKRALFPKSDQRKPDVNPITREHLKSLIYDSQLTPATQLAFWLAARTASRMDEICRLTRDQVLVRGPNVMTIFFGDKTKGSRRTPFRPDTTVTVHTLAPNDRHFHNRLTTLLYRTKPEDKLFAPLLPAQAARILRRKFPGSHYGAKSIKKGIAILLLSLVYQKKLTWTVYRIMLKHSPKRAPVDATSIRYTQTRRSLMADALGTPKATSQIEIA